MDISRILYTLMCILGSTWTQALTVCDQCDCTLSENTDDEKGNAIVKPSCSEGRITWMNPHGAMRLELNPGIFTDFRACVIVKSDNTKTKVSKEVQSTKYKNHRTKYLENEVKLEPWFTVIDRSREYCVQSTDKQPVLLYVETETTTNSTGLPRVTVLYDIEKYSPLQEDLMEECRPCDEEELINAFCTSHFVVVGRIADVLNYPDEDRTRIGVEVDQLIRQSTEQFTRIKRTPATQVDNHIIHPGYRSDSLLYGQIFAPEKCGIQRGEGTLLFTGRVRLGEPKLRCAPFYEDWRKILETATRDGTMECSFD
ncbi:hypothetical protein SNE40_018810 [Patella caerulea]|uniref:Meteorin-like protein n=1 Tax=Patella caerulea TaxID=87958 RepID=A0AAN8J758_PATCE